MKLKVGIVRDERFLVHQTGLVHPERPGRLKAIYRMLDTELNDRLVSIEPQLATLEDLELVHTPTYIKKILRTAEREFTNLTPDTPVSAQSCLAAWLAVGGCIRAVNALLSGRCDACFCLIRPPGHHALKDRAGGFCIFNNVAVAARHAIERHGLQRTLIIDWDVHHGNGIQDQFYEEREVLYVSTHYMGWYPQTGDWEEVGAGQGVGYTVNIPIPKEIEDPDIVYVYWKVLGPIMRSFRPELILVAAGFDAHHRDPIGRTKLTKAAYRRLTEMLIELRDPVSAPPLLFILEGGYDVSALVACVREVLIALTWEDRRANVPVAMTARGAELVARAEHIHKKFKVWAE
jgi:acetoin utilization deacetylase AcuC-like enzyme